jgi:hypothetical protein
MFRTTAAAAVLGSAALTLAALTSGTAAATPASNPAPPPPTQQQAAAAGVAPGVVVQSGNTARFTMVRSTAAEKAGCLGAAKAMVNISKQGTTEEMKIFAWGLPKQTDFDLFVLQVPDAPFGQAWYQSDLRSGEDGTAFVDVRGRFNEETFSVATGTAPAPKVHAGDATSNPVTKPLHQYHLGFWFNSPAAAAKAGCPGTVTPFNGEHDAGVQAMSSRNFPIARGPLGEIKS